MDFSPCVSGEITNGKKYAASRGLSKSAETLKNFSLVYMCMHEQHFRHLNILSKKANKR